MSFKKHCRAVDDKETFVFFGVKVVFMDYFGMRWSDIHKTTPTGDGRDGLVHPLVWWGLMIKMFKKHRMPSNVWHKIATLGTKIKEVFTNYNWPTFLIFLLVRDCPCALLRYFIYLHVTCRIHQWSQHPGGTSVNFRKVCAMKGLKPWPYLRIKDMKNDTLYMTLRTSKMILPWREKNLRIHVTWMVQLYFVPVTLKVYSSNQFQQIFFFT